MLKPALLPTNNCEAPKLFTVESVWTIESKCQWCMTEVTEQGYIKFSIRKLVALYYAVTGSL